MDIKKIVVAVSILLIVLAGAAVGIYLFQQQQDIRSSADPATTINITVDDTTPAVGEAFEAYLNIDTAENHFIIAYITVTFDPAVLNASGVRKGIFAQVANLQGIEINNTAGNIYFELVVPVNEDPLQGSGILAIVDFDAVNPGTSIIDLSDDTIIGASGEEQNVLIGTTPATVIVGGGATPTPSPSPTATPDPNDPSPSPTATPNGSSTPTPSPTGTGNGGGTGGTSSSPTGDTNATSTPFANGTTLPESGVGDYTFVLLGGAIILILTSAALFVL